MLQVKHLKERKQKGAVKLTYNNINGCSDADPKINLAVGHKITTNSGDSYLLTSPAELTCPKIVDVNVEAVDIGEEFNIKAGRSFTVAGYTTNLSGFNASDFTGGLKKEYTILSQQDVDNAVTSLSESAIEEVKSDLRKKETRWDIIEDTIKSEVDKGTIKTDIAVGAEASLVNLDVTIKGTATFYQTSGLNEGLTDLLREEATEQNLFESKDNLELVLGDNIEKELKVEESTGDTISINLTASATVKPKVSKTDIENKLRGMSWGSGSFILS
jgi:hypothetical protein